MGITFYQTLFAAACSLEHLFSGAAVLGTEKMDFAEFVSEVKDDDEHLVGTQVCVSGLSGVGSGESSAHTWILLEVDGAGVHNFFDLC